MPLGANRIGMHCSTLPAGVPTPPPGKAMTKEGVKMTLRQLRLPTFCVLALAVVGLSSPSAASPITTVPSGLAPGSFYRLVFVTANVYQATSPNISTYNTDVNTEANSSALAALGTTWTAIGSTDTSNAITNIGIDAGVPIYGLDGNKVAGDAGTGANGLFGGSLLAPFFVTETGGSVAGLLVWTGTVPSGIAAFGGALGSGSVDVVFGAAGSIAPIIWIGSSTSLAVDDHRLYGISGELTVPATATPEPSTPLMMIAGGALMVVTRLRTKHRENRATRALC